MSALRSEMELVTCLAEAKSGLGYSQVLAFVRTVKNATTRVPDFCVFTRTWDVVLEYGGHTVCVDRHGTRAAWAYLTFTPDPIQLLSPAFLRKFALYLTSRPREVARVPVPPPFAAQPYAKDLRDLGLEGPARYTIDPAAKRITLLTTAANDMPYPAPYRDVLARFIARNTPIARGPLRGFLVLIQ